MPSTTSSSVSAVLASSTVMTPSLPTFCIAWAIIWPIEVSPLAEMVPTWATSSEDFTFLARPWMSFTTSEVAMSMPRFRSIGFMPAATDLAPSRTIEAASTVAVVVPSPAMSFVFEATSRTIWAPMFSNLSWSSISLATVTPSLVMRGAPYDLSRMTLRPFGPSVILTALLRTSMPRSMRSRASVENLTSLAAMGLPPVRVGVERQAPTRPFIFFVKVCSTTPMMSLSFMMRRSSPSMRTSVPDHLPNRTRSPAFTSSGTILPLSARAPGPAAMISPSCGFSFAVSGMMMPPFVFSSASIRRTTTRSCSGRNFMNASLEVRWNSGGPLSTPTGGLPSRLSCTVPIRRRQAGAGGVGAWRWVLGRAASRRVATARSRAGGMPYPAPWRKDAGKPSLAPREGTRLLRLHAQGAVEADGFAVEHVVVDDGTHELGLFLRRPEPRRKRDAGLERLAELLRDRVEHRRCEQPRHDGHDADAVAREVAGDREREAEDAALRGRVGGLADLAVGRRHRGRAHDEAAAAVRRHRLEFRHGGRALGAHLVGADEVDLDGPAEGGNVVGDEGPGLAVLGHRAAGRRDAGAVDEDAGGPMGAARLAQRTVDGFLVGDVRFAEHGADLAGDPFAALAVHVEQRDLDALAGEHAGRGLAEAGGAARDDGGNRAVELHGANSSCGRHMAGPLGREGLAGGVHHDPRCRNLERAGLLTAPPGAVQSGARSAGALRSRAVQQHTGIREGTL